MGNTTRKQSKYKELEQIEQELSLQRENLRSQLKYIEERLAAVVLAIQVWKNTGPAATSKNESNPYLRTLRGLTQVQALVKIAKDGGNNRFKLKDAKNLLLEAGLVKSKKNASTILFTAIHRSGKFKRVAPGEYEVLPERERLTNAMAKGVDRDDDRVTSTRLGITQ
jgi:hypothetical protein